jgi:glutamate synthase domain-containing protein 2
LTLVLAVGFVVTGVVARPRIIGAKRAQPYHRRRFANISGMSYGALSPNAVRALWPGAKMA